MNLAYLHPRYWLTWLGIGLLRAIILLPWKVQMAIGHGIGLILFYLLKKRRLISCINLQLAFPKLDREQRAKLTKKHFISLAQSLFDSSLAWWGSDKRLHSLTTIEGSQYLSDAKKTNKGIVLLSAHFNSLEIGPRVIGMQTELHVMYRPHQNPLIDELVTQARTKQYGKAIAKDNMRGMIQSLKHGKLFWYAQDQKPPSNKYSIFSPFFNVATPTNTALSRIVKISNASVVPFFTVREKQGYKLIFLPALDNFPSDDLQADTDRINKIIESQIKQYPEQYLWAHQRFRDAPDGSNRYKSHRLLKECLIKS